MYLKQSAVIGLLLVSASPVFADDASRFAGVYGGLSYNWARSSGTATALGPTAAWETPGTVTSYSGAKNGIGGQIGYQTKVYNNVLLGAELSVTQNDVTKTVQSPSVAWHNDTMTFSNITMLSGRVGYARSAWSVYGKAGYAQSKVTYRMADTAFPTNYYNLSQNVNGVSLGIGAEYVLMNHYSLSIEHNRINWGAFSGAGAQVPANGEAFSIRTKTNMTSVRVSYLF